MDRKVLWVLLLCSFVQGMALAAIFEHNLPYWCANPEVGGNWIVQPLCKGK